MALDAERHARLAPTQREKRWHSGRFSAFREALEMYDAAQRSVALNGPVEMRTFSEIEDEING